MPYRAEKRRRAWPRNRFSSPPAIWSPTGATAGRSTISRTAIPRPPPISWPRWWRPRRASPPPGSRSPSIREQARRPRRRGRRVPAARDADREDYHGARLHLARLGAAEGDAGDDRDLRAAAVRPARAGVRAVADASGWTIAGRRSCWMRCRRRLAAPLRVRLGARSRLRHRAGGRCVPAVLRLARRHRSLARHDRAGARQGRL